MQTATGQPYFTVVRQRENKLTGTTLYICFFGFAIDLKVGTHESLR